MVRSKTTFILSLLLATLPVRAFAADASPGPAPEEKISSAQAGPVVAPEPELAAKRSGNWRGGARRAEPVDLGPPKRGVGDFFKRLDPRTVFQPKQFEGDIVTIDDDADAPEPVAKKADPKAQDWKADPSVPTAPKVEELKFRSENPNDDVALPADQTPSVRLEPDAPSSIKEMVRNKRIGNTELANQYADQFVRYQQNYFFELRDMVAMIGEALIRQKVISDDDWVGAEQYMDRELATTRDQQGQLLRPTHDVAMKRIKPDEKNQVEVFYFFTLNCSWCRFMAADIERLYRVVKKDKNIKFTALTLGPVPEEWLVEYRQYSGLSMPVYDGTDFAKKFRIGFVPAVVVIAPTSNRAYLKTGQQSFERLYDFVRTVQGLPANITPEVELVMKTPIGQNEKSQLAKNGAKGRLRRDENGSDVERSGENGSEENVESSLAQAPHQVISPPVTPVKVEVQRF